ncbi:MAG: pilus assembly protein CpaF [Lachnospiraceae bacterium]|nr:pilus assembly protein CpaF [Lachnospiraceae bacterium]
MLINYIALLILICAFLLILYLLFRENRLQAKKIKNEEIYTMEAMITALKSHFSEILNGKGKTKKLRREEAEKVEQIRKELRRAMNFCSYGDLRSKAYVKEYIKDWLINCYGVSEITIDQVLPFKDTRKLMVEDKFLLLLFHYEKQYQQNAFRKILENHNLTPEYLGTKDLTAPYTITAEDIERIYQKEHIRLSFLDKLDVVVQKIYQEYKGHGVIDELRDCHIDGISGGVSGSLSPSISKDDSLLRSIWVFYRGLMIHLDFLAFSSERELQRICRNIYRYGQPGQLSAVKGYIVNEMMDGSRVVVARPPFAESWTFFVRKFDYRGVMMLQELLTDEGSEKIITLLKLLIHGEQIMGITGEQGSGKTTLLKSLIQFISPTYTLRVQELVFELHLREIYPDRNIVSFRETEFIPGRDGLDLQKKTDGTVNIIGEVASAPVASWLVMISQVASKFTLFTHHAKTTKSLIMALRNDLMITGAFQNEHAAEEQVKLSIRFDVHATKNASGHRYVERITEIVPTGSDSIVTRDILRLINGRYEIVNPISEETQKEMKAHLTKEDIKELELLFAKEEGEMTS